MNVVIVAGTLPYPANTGSRLRTLHLLVRLARRHRLTLVAPREGEPSAARRAVEYLGDHGIEAVEFGAPVPPKSGIGFAARLALNLVSTLPYSVACRRGPGLGQALRRLAEKRRVDLWQSESVIGVDAFQAIAGARTVLHAHNVETQIWERHAANTPDPLKRWYIGLQARRYERLERRAFAEAGRVVAVSPDDAALMTGRFGVPADRVDVVDNGIDRAAFECLGPSAEFDPRRILFLGSLDWRPNVDAAGLLLDRIFPAVRAEAPGATLEIVGRNPSATLVERAAATAGVSLFADVPEVGPFLARAGLTVVPLRVGGGSRLKILESLAAGVPVVSTRVGAEGLELEPGRDLSIVDGPDAMAGAILACLRQPEEARAQARQARPRVLERYDWDHLADALEQSWERCVSGVGTGAEAEASVR